MPDLSGTLLCEIRELAASLGLPLGLEGEAFALPARAHLRAGIEAVTLKNAGLGKNSPTRLDGALAITAVSPLPGCGAETAGSLAARIAAFFPRGSSLDYAGPEGAGEIIFSAPTRLEPRTEAGRVRLTVKISFYAILFQESDR